jgi:UDP-N-acetylmuramyl pentapeptide synthase
VDVAIVPASQPEVVEGAKGRAKRVVATGLDTGDLRASAWGVGPDGRGSVTVDGVQIDVPLRGVHNLRNTMLALAVTREAGVSLEDAARGIASMPAPPMRVNWEQLGAVTLINDAYNSNPGSARAAIELLDHAGQGRQKVAVLATMLELGPTTPSLHDDVARATLATGVGLVAAMGEFAAAFRRIAPGDPRVICADDVDSLWSLVSSRLSPDAVILLKGSRGMRLERLVAPITAWANSRQPA